MTIKDWLFIYFLEQYPDIGMDLRLGFKPHVPRAVMDAYLSLGKAEEKASKGNFLVHEGKAIHIFRGLEP